MLYPVVPLQEWQQRYGLKVRKRRCFGCARMLTTVVPFADRYGFGLVSPPCACGSSGSISTRTLRDGVLVGLTREVR